jgi:hypothetical protein
MKRITTMNNNTTATSKMTIGILPDIKLEKTPFILPNIDGLPIAPGAPGTPGAWVAVGTGRVDSLEGLLAILLGFDDMLDFILEKK